MLSGGMQSNRENEETRAAAIASGHIAADTRRGAYPKGYDAPILQSHVPGEPVFCDDTRLQLSHESVTVKF